MRLPRRLAPPGLPNLLPLIDVVLMLVVFFLVATVFRVGPGLALDLPTSTTAQNVRVTSLKVTVTGPDEVWVGDEAGTLATLEARLARALEGEDRATLRVVVEGTKDAPYQAVVSVLDGLRRQNVTGVNLMTRLAGASK